MNLVFVLRAFSHFPLSKNYNEKPKIKRKKKKTRRKMEVEQQ